MHPRLVYKTPQSVTGDQDAGMAEARLLCDIPFWLWVPLVIELTFKLVHSFYNGAVLNWGPIKGTLPTLENYPDTSSSGLVNLGRAWMEAEAGLQFRACGANVFGLGLPGRNDLCESTQPPLQRGHIYNLIMYIYIYMMCVYIYIYTYTYMSVFICLHVYIYIHIYTYIYIYVHKET